jgi:hypothetical protein
MKTIACALIAIAFEMPLQGYGDALLCQGAMASTVHYATTRDIIVPEGTYKVVVQIPTALNAGLFAYSQRVLSFSISYSRKTDDVKLRKEGSSPRTRVLWPRLIFRFQLAPTTDT